MRTPAPTILLKLLLLLGINQSFTLVARYSSVSFYGAMDRIDSSIPFGLGSTNAKYFKYLNLTQKAS